MTPSGFDGVADKHAGRRKQRPCVPESVRRRNFLHVQDGLGRRKPSILGSTPTPPDLALVLSLSLQRAGISQRNFARAAHMTESRLSRALTGDGSLRPEEWGRLLALARLRASVMADLRRDALEKIGGPQTDDEIMKAALDIVTKRGLGTKRRRRRRDEPSFFADSHLTVLFQPNSKEAFEEKVKEEIEPHQLSTKHRGYGLTASIPELGMCVQTQPWDPGRSGVRIEFYMSKDAPSPFLDSVLQLMEGWVLPFVDLKSIRVSRADFAVDYDLPPESFHLVARHARKYRITMSNRRIETQDIGNKGSPVSFCVYNKRLQVREKGLFHIFKPHRPDWTRIDARCRFNPTIRLVDLPDIQNPYARLTFFDLSATPMEFPYNLLALAMRDAGMGNVERLCRDPAILRGFKERLLECEKMGADPGPVEMFELHGRPMLTLFINTLRKAARRLMRREAHRRSP